LKLLLFRKEAEEKGGSCTCRVVVAIAIALKF